MKILYKQPSENNSGIFYNTYIKKISIDGESLTYSNKEHHHTCFEMHIIMKGYQTYIIDNVTYRVEAGSFLLIPPKKKHLLSEFSSHAEKYSITFITDIEEILSGISKCVHFKTPPRILDNLSFIDSETNRKLEFSSALIENCSFETIITILRLAGFSEKNATPAIRDNARLTLAKQFIKDNIEFMPTVAVIAEYCNLSTKQLTRLFKAENTTPLNYINSQKIKVIQNLLIENTLTLKEIAAKFNFNNEYYFNSYFKKYAGMPPGEYRLMHTQK